MKKVIIVSLFCAAVMLLLPLSVIKTDFKTLSTTAIQKDTVKKIKPATYSTSFKVLNCEDNTITEMKTADYIFGVIAAEMPALYETEALKAQAVAAYTFALNRKAENSDKNYDITNDHTIDQSFITEEKARENWGNNADTYCEKIKKAVNEASGYVILHNGKIITSVYHAISSGKTEDSNNVWGVALPYLKSVSSVGDTLANKYISKAEFSFSELKEKLNTIADIEDNKQNIFKDIVKTESGTVKTVTVGDEKTSGAKIRNALNLRSSCFDVSYTNEKYIFTVYGYGHGVGMSQNGANYMAKQGFDFKEILTHYYTNCTVEKNN